MRSVVMTCAPLVAYMIFIYVVTYMMVLTIGALPTALIMVPLAFVGGAVVAEVTR